MALTDYQRTVCRLLAAHRVASGESYVAGGVALNEWLGAPRLSRDVDLFHDTESAVELSWTQDRALLESSGYAVRVVRERPGFVEAEIRSEGQSLHLEWVRDSSFRFFPLVEHADLGLTLHPFDLATNKLLALVGRREVRDWIDVLECDARLQPLGYLAWAACGKDPGFSPTTLVEHAARGGRFTAPEVAGLAFAGERPDLANLSRSWHAAIDQARELLAVLPPEEAGKCVLTAEGEPCRQPAAAIDATPSILENLRFHPGSIRGAFPSLLPTEG